MMSYMTKVVSGETSMNNTSIIPLGIGATFEGISEYNKSVSVMVSIATDKNGTLFIEFSQDGINWDTSLSFFYNTSRINPPHIFEKGNRYFRVRFENTSGEAQTYFRLLTTYGMFSNLTSPINGTLSENYDATVVRPTDYKSEVAMGKRQGRTAINKWGYNLDVDTGGEEIVASWGGAFNPNTDVIDVAQTFTVTYNNGTDGLGSTGATQLLVDYLDGNFDLQQGVHVLGNTGSEVTTFTGLGINRIVVIANGGMGWNVNDITFTATTDLTTQGQVPALKSSTQQCIFHTPINHTLLLEWLRGNVLRIDNGGSKTAPVVSISGYSWSRVTNTRYEVFREDIDTAVENHLYVDPPIPFVFGGREVFFLEASTDTNNTTIKMRFSGILERVK